MKEPFSSMESVLSSHLAFYSDGSPWRNLSAPWSQCFLPIGLSTMESVLSFLLAFYSDGSPWRNLLAPWSQCWCLFILFSVFFIHIALFQACTAIANGMPIVTQLPASWYTHPCHTHNGWVFKNDVLLVRLCPAAGSHIFDNHCDTALRGARAMQVSTHCMHGSHSRSGDIYRITLVSISLLLVSELPTHMILWVQWQNYSNL